MTLPPDEAMEKGLMLMWVYNCLRCGYLWLPRSYDPTTQDIETMDPPKACAKCKSKYWNRIKSRL